jgi:hypothetical protein
LKKIPMLCQGTLSGSRIIGYLCLSNISDFNLDISQYITIKSWLIPFTVEQFSDNFDLAFVLYYKSSSLYLWHKIVMR